MAKKQNCGCECDFCPVVVLIALCTAPIALFAVGFALALPYGHIRHFSEDPVTCHVTSVHQRGLYACNYCDEEYGRCFSKFPCMEILVEYVSQVNQSLVKNGTLYHHPYNYLTDKRLQVGRILHCHHHQHHPHHHHENQLQQHYLILSST